VNKRFKHGKQFNVGSNLRLHKGPAA